MKASNYKAELLTDVEHRLEHIQSLVTRIDVDLLKQRRSIFEYIYTRSEDSQKQSIKEFDDILHMVNYFSNQIPDFYRLTKDFTSQHSKRLQESFQNFEQKNENFDFNNQVAAEKSKEFELFLERILVSHSAIVNAEELNETFMAVFIPCATNIYEALIGIMNYHDDQKSLKQSVYDNWGVILPSLEILKKS